jgi:hypothetical protein
MMTDERLQKDNDIETNLSGFEVWKLYIILWLYSILVALSS